MTNLFDLSGKGTAVVGGAGGIGQAIAEGLAEAGAEVLIASRRADSLKRAQTEIAANGEEVLCHVCDATKEDEVTSLLEASLAALGEVDILVNAQGFNKKFPGTEFPLDVWDQLLEVNITSLMLTSKHFGKHKDADKHGKIINLSSVRGIRAVGNGGMGNVGYCSTKGAVEMLTKAFASDLGPKIQVNAIGPTITYTTMMVGLLPDDEAARNAIAKSMPTQRIGYPDDCKGPAIFLASAASDFVTGPTICTDGGLTAVG